MNCNQSSIREPRVRRAKEEFFLKKKNFLKNMFNFSYHEIFFKNLWNFPIDSCLFLRKILKYFF